MQPALDEQPVAEEKGQGKRKEEKGNEKEKKAKAKGAPEQPSDLVFTSQTGEPRTELFVFPRLGWWLTLRSFGPLRQWRKASMRRATASAFRPTRRNGPRSHPSYLVPPALT